MPMDDGRLGRYAAALQCVAEDFRSEASQSAIRPRELRQFATLLDHMAASLIVLRPAEPVLVRAPSLEMASPRARAKHCDQRGASSP